MKYNLELEKVINQIKKQKAKSVLIQLPDGLKPKAIEIVDELEKATNTTILIYSGTCFGACDIPTDVKVDLIVQFGHSSWLYNDKNIKVV